MTWRREAIGSGGCDPNRWSMPRWPILKGKSLLGVGQTCRTRSQSKDHLTAVIEWVLAGSYDLTNTRVSGGTGYLSGNGTGCGLFLGIILR